MNKEKIKLEFEAEHEECNHSGCSGAVYYTLTLIKENGERLTHTDGGCFGSDMEDRLGAIKAALELLGYEADYD